MATQADYDRLGGWAAILDSDLNIDRRQCQRQVPMQVLSLGAPRTGTLSMSEAYDILGIPSYHYASVLANCKDSDMWIEALEAKYNPQKNLKSFGKPEFDQLLGHVGAVTDVPCVMFWKELLEAYPEAKVVLVEREDDRWLRSIEGVARGVLNPVGRFVLRLTDPGRTGRILNLGLTWMRYWFGVKGFLTVGSVMKNASQTYRSHYSAIRATVPQSKLLEYKLGTGWEPLCTFLGKEIPNVPFPHRNDAATLDLAFGVLLKSAFKRSLFNISIVSAIGVAIISIVAKHPVFKR